MIDTLVPSAPTSSADEFVRLTMQETGCPRAVARTALRLIMRRHRPQIGRLPGYLARFTPADRAYWVDRALAAERAALALILIGEFAEQRSVGRAVSAAGADREMLALARSSDEDGGRVRGLALLDAALDEMRQGSPRAAAVIDAVVPRPPAAAASGVAAGPPVAANSSAVVRGRAVAGGSVAVTAVAAGTARGGVS